MRPRFPSLSVLATALLTSAAMPSAAPAQTVFLGNYAESIHAAEFDASTGRLARDRPVAALAKASFLAKSADGRFLYAVAEGKEGGLHAYSVGADGMLTTLNSRPSEGAAPCDISLSPDGKLVAAANYTGGSVIVYRVAPDGALGDQAGFFQHTHAADVFPGRQKGPHAHGVTWTPDGRLLLVPDLGGDRVYLYARDAASGAMAPHAAQPWLALPAGSGPRHARVSPDARHLYIINELANTVSVAAYDAKSGALALVETVPTLPAGAAGAATKTAEIEVSADGRVVYASNRGHDTLAVFARDAVTGRLTPRGHVAVPANPRHFALSPDGRWLLCAGQDAGAVAVFAVDAASGALTPAGEPFVTPKPVCVRF